MRSYISKENVNMWFTKALLFKINRSVVQEGRRLSSNREEMAVRLRPTIYWRHSVWGAFFYGLVEDVAYFIILRVQWTDDEYTSLISHFAISNKLKLNTCKWRNDWYRPCNRLPTLYFLWLIRLRNLDVAIFLSLCFWLYAKKFGKVFRWLYVVQKK